MLINSINWLIDCKKDLTSRQPTKPHMAAILWGLCRRICLSVLWQLPLRRRRTRDGMSNAQPWLALHGLGSLMKQSLTSRGSLETQALKMEGKPTAIMLMPVDFLHTPPLAVSASPCLRWQTFLHACRHATEPVTTATAASIDVCG